ncbi:site-specific integrase [Geotalea sp. SG265]|uniref:tyrosine-type recombinase/integrase n=1 Tax=Geotalea sp. SG265 TaxID=2922867 RepID=UPI001FAED61E|nr:site-specific integrase [Geotalea sp. SG265]
MTVYKRGAKGVFYMDFVVKGERVYKSTERFTKREAVLIEATEKKRLMEEATLSPKEKSSRLKLSEAIKVVFDERWKDNKDGNKSQRNAERLIDHVGDIPIGRIDEEVFRKLVKKLETTGIEPATINRYLASLKTLLRHHGQRWEHIKLKKERKGRIRVLSDEEEVAAIQLLRETIHPPKRAYFKEIADLAEVLVDTGMRLSEAINLNYLDVNFRTNLISIWFNKGDRPRSVPMTSRVKAILKARKAGNPVKPFSVDIHQADHAWDWVRKTMGLQNDKEFVLHALRHTCASRLVNRDIDLYVVKEWLGHSSIQVTEKYAHLSPSKLKEAASSLEPEKVLPVDVNIDGSHDKSSYRRKYLHAVK